MSKIVNILLRLCRVQTTNAMMKRLVTPDNSGPVVVDNLVFNRDKACDTTNNRLKFLLQSDDRARSIINEYFNHCILNEVMSTKRATIFMDESRRFVLKATLIDGNLSGTTAARIERDAYKVMANSSGNVTQYFTSYVSRYFVFIIVESAGVDGYDMITRDLVTASNWRLGVIEIRNGVNAIHKKGLIHGDIKIENIGFNAKSNCWKVFDLGAASLKHRKTSPTGGTHPMILPHMCTNRKGVKGNSYVPSHETTPEHYDMYSYAITMLSFVGLIYTEVCDKCYIAEKPCDSCHNLETENQDWCRFDVQRLYNIRYQLTTSTCEEFSKRSFVNQSGFSMFDVKTIHSLIDIILSQLDCSRKYLLWSRPTHSSKYYLQNELYSDSIKEQNIDEAWASLD